jgi:hypothetical protein
MIRWHQTHSGVFATVLLALSMIAFYLVLTLPFEVPEVIAGGFYFIPGALLVAVVDHGHAQTPWSRRIWRLLASWALTVLWLIVGAYMVSIFTAASFSLGETPADVWATIWPLMVVAAVLAWFGMLVIRWMERQIDPFARGKSKLPLTDGVRVDKIRFGKQV